VRLLEVTYTYDPMDRLTGRRRRSSIQPARPRSATVVTTVVDHNQSRVVRDR
jgi:hypothetical protein